MYESIVPRSLEDTILTYLKDQEGFDESSDTKFHIKHASMEEQIEDVLNELLIKVNKRITCRDRYENLKTWHHQYPLFDLSTFIPNFCIDDEMFEKLAFKETLLISEINSHSASRETEPKAVGGLCLDIQIVEGHQPVNRQMPNDAELDREVFMILQKIKTAPNVNQAGQSTQAEKEVQKKLQEYEAFLKNEMQANVKKFLVHFSSQFDVQGCNAGSTITSWVDRQFHTLEEKRVEFIKDSTDINEKILYVAIQNQKYYMRHKSKLTDQDIRKYYPFYITKDLMLEGANFILMRYLAMTKFVGTIELSTMYIAGDMCRNIYECIGPKPGTVNGETIEVCKIYRYVVEQCGLEHHGVTVLTTYGRIVTQEWEACNYILNVNPLQYIDDKPPPPYSRLMLKKTWKNDLQLMSEYLNCKTSAERHMKTYMSDHPEVKEIISDFVQNALLLKPENIMDFTMDYFQNLYPCKTPRIPYLEDTEKGGEDIDFC